MRSTLHVCVGEEEWEVVSGDVIDGKASETERDHFARISLEVELCKRNVRSRSRLHPRIAESEASVLCDFATKSAKKLVVEPPVTVDLRSVLRPSRRLLHLCFFFFCHGAHHMKPGVFH